MRKKIKTSEKIAKSFKIENQTPEKILPDFSKK